MNNEAVHKTRDERLSNIIMRRIINDNSTDK